MELGRSLLAFTCAVTLTLLAAGCGASDADRIDEFAQAVSGEITSERIAQALARYVDLAQQPLEVNVFGDPRSYAPEQSAQLAEQAQARLSSMLGVRLSVLRRHIAIDGPRAQVELQLLGRGGMSNVRYVLQKHGDRWLISYVNVGG